jgi:hypothetical protein
MKTDRKLFYSQSYYIYGTPIRNERKMSQPQLSKKPLRKGMVIGIVLLILSFVFFYLAGSIAYEVTTQSNDVVNPVSKGVSYAYEFGTSYHYPIKPYKIVMQPNDYLTISREHYPTNGAVYITLWDENAHEVLKYTDWIFLDFRNELSSNMLVEAHIATQNENTVSTTVTLHHYERPNWIFLSVGVITALLAGIAIFKSRH